MMQYLTGLLQSNKFEQNIIIIIFPGRYPIVYNSTKTIEYKESICEIISFRSFNIDHVYIVTATSQQTFDSREEGLNCISKDDILLLQNEII